MLNSIHAKTNVSLSLDIMVLSTFVVDYLSCMQVEGRMKRMDR